MINFSKKNTFYPKLKRSKNICKLYTSLLYYLSKVIINPLISMPEPQDVQAKPEGTHTARIPNDIYLPIKFFCAHQGGDSIQEVIASILKDRITSDPAFKKYLDL